MAGAREILVDQSEFSRREKLYCPQRKGIEIRYLFSLKMEFQKPHQIVKSEKYETLFVSKLLIWRQKWAATVRHGNAIVARRDGRVSRGRVLVVLFRPKYAIHRQIKLKILKLTIRRGQSNFSIVFIFVRCEENGCYRVVSIEQLSFACRSYCGRSRRVQGDIENEN